MLLPFSVLSQQPPSCCTIAKNKGQEAFNKKDYATAISHWTSGKKCSDAASKCTDLDALIQKAKSAKQKQEAATESAKQKQAELDRQRKADAAAERKRQAAEQARQHKAAEAQAAFNLAKKINTKAAYDAFIADHSESSILVAHARKRIADLDKVANPAPTVKSEPPVASLPAPLRKLEAEMVSVTGGTFTMGCKNGRDTGCYDDEKPPHDVRVRNFAICRYEVTQAQWRTVMGSDPPELNNKGCDACPVERVSWDDIQAFLKKLNSLTGKRYRLPTEAEWEFAARGGNQSRGYLYSGSNTIGEVAWYGSNSGSKTHPVGGKKANELGLYDMSGNVWEWCADDWHSNYNGAPTDGSAWVDSPRASYRVFRGGSWGDTARFCRVADRNDDAPARRGGNVGFRLAL